MLKALEEIFQVFKELFPSDVAFLIHRESPSFLSGLDNRRFSESQKQLIGNLRTKSFLAIRRIQQSIGYDITITSSSFTEF